VLLDDTDNVVMLRVEVLPLVLLLVELVRVRVRVRVRNSVDDDVDVGSVIVSVAVVVEVSVAVAVEIAKQYPQLAPWHASSRTKHHSPPGSCSGLQQELGQNTPLDVHVASQLQPCMVWRPSMLSPGAMETDHVVEVLLVLVVVNVLVELVRVSVDDDVDVGSVIVSVAVVVEVSVAVAVEIAKQYPQLAPWHASSRTKHHSPPGSCSGLQQELGQNTPLDVQVCRHKQCLFVYLSPTTNLTKTNTHSPAAVIIPAARWRWGGLQELPAAWKQHAALRTPTNSGYSYCR